MACSELELELENEKEMDFRAESLCVASGLGQEAVGEIEDEETPAIHCTVGLGAREKRAGPSGPPNRARSVERRMVIPVGWGWWFGYPWPVSSVEPARRATRASMTAAFSGDRSTDVR
jgi:hypothetical protein